MIRAARPDDAEQLISLKRSLFAEGRYFVSELDEYEAISAYESERISRRQHRRGDREVVAIREQRVVGWLRFSAGSLRRRSHRGTMEMGVAAAWRGHGIGGRLLDGLLTWARENEIEKINAEVLSWNTPALQLYRSRGFLEHGRLVDDIKLGPGVYLDVVLVTRSLR
jgi:GNAT superfamily N-acetyltransferase